MTHQCTDPAQRCALLAGGTPRQISCTTPQKQRSDTGDECCINHACLEHLLYILGFGMLMLIVGSRVLFGHSDDLDGFFVKSQWVRVLAAITRATPAWVPFHNRFTPHLRRLHLGTSSHTLATVAPPAVR